MFWSDIQKFSYSIFRLQEYATASTSDAVYIIGGYTGCWSKSRLSTIAEFKDGRWRRAGNLANSRIKHGAITLGSLTMVVGGYTGVGGRS